MNSPSPSSFASIPISPRIYIIPPFPTKIGVDILLDAKWVWRRGCGRSLRVLAIIIVVPLCSAPHPKDPLHPDPNPLLPSGHV